MASVVVLSFADRYADGAGRRAMAWWIHDHLPYSQLQFFPKLAAFNIGWRERPRRRLCPNSPALGSNRITGSGSVGATFQLGGKLGVGRCGGIEKTSLISLTSEEANPAAHGTEDRIARCQAQAGRSRRCVPYCGRDLR